MEAIMRKSQALKELEKDPKAKIYKSEQFKPDYRDKLEFD